MPSSTDRALVDGALQASSIVQPVLEVHLLGTFRVACGPHTVHESAWRLGKARNLVQLLALSPGHKLHREQVMDHLWPDLSPKAAAGNLYQVIHAARRALAAISSPSVDLADAIQFRRQIVTLDPPTGLWVDVVAFEAAAERARRTGELHDYEAARDAYTGNLLPADQYEEWTTARRNSLREMLLTLLSRLAEMYEARDEPEPAIEMLRQALSYDPLSEEAHVGLMRLYASSGRRQRALEQFERLQAVMERELGIEPGRESRQLYQDLMDDRLHSSATASRPARTSSASVQHNIPHRVSSFVGRERESGQVLDQLGAARLVTLTGPGGSGKTRLALEVASGLVHQYPDGVWLVELAPVRDPALVASAIAQVLGLREAGSHPVHDALLAHLRDRHLLLVLDNFEHVLAAAPLVTDLLASCAGLTVLVTSRARLRLSGEHEISILPLLLPESEAHVDLAQLARNPAVALFVSRARAVAPDFELTSANAAAVVDICRRLDGLPLGIELAAARIKLLPARALRDRLDQRLPLLVDGPRDRPARQQTLRDTIAWSYDLLSEEEQRLFRRLAVFVGGWTLEAAEAVSRGAIPDIVGTLATLLDHSLVQQVRQPDGTARFTMLETIREFGLTRLEGHGETGDAHRRHAEFFLDQVEQAEPALVGPDQQLWLDRLEIEHDNIRAALGWTLDRSDADRPEVDGLALRLGAAFWRFWFIRGHWSEGRGWLDRALQATPDGDQMLRFKALGGIGQIAHFQGDYPVAATVVEDILAACRAIGDNTSIAFWLANRGFVAAFQMDQEHVSAIEAELIERRPQLVDSIALANVDLFLGLAAAVRGDLDQSVLLHERSLERFREFGDPQWILGCMMNLGIAAVARSDWDLARSMFLETLSQSRDTRNVVCLHYALLGLGLVAVGEGQPIRGVQLLGAAQRLRDTVGLYVPLLQRLIRYDAMVKPLRVELGEERFSTAWTAGRMMPLDAAIEHALS